MPRFLGYVRTFSNWPLIYFERYGLTRPWRHLELRMRSGMRLLVRSGTADVRMSRSVLIDRTYLTPPLEIRDDAVVVDVGANIGSFSLLAASLAPNGRVLAYEPEPSNVTMLRKNIERNKAHNVEWFQRAVAAEEGPRTMYSPPEATATGEHSLLGSGDKVLDVECTTLARIAEEHGLDRIDFLKLDCEGAEVEILLSTPDSTLRRISQIAMEIHDWQASRPMLQRLAAAGFAEHPVSKANHACFKRS